MNTMAPRRLGGTDLEISPIGFGGWAIGGDRNSTGGLGPADDGEALAAIRRALDLGVNWIDTAPGYGAGHSEELVGKAIRGMSERPLISTKCGFVWDEQNALTNSLSRESIRTEVERSLRRLGIDAIDLYQIHWVEPDQDHLIEEAWATLADLKGEGKVRHIGVSNFDITQMNRAEAVAPIEAIQPPYSLLERSIEGAILPYCREHNVGVIVYSPMQSGLLTGAMTRERIDRFPANDARRFDPNFVDPLLEANLSRVERLRQLAREWGWTPGEISVAWTLRRSDVNGAIVGFRRPDQVDGLCGRGHIQLDPNQLAGVEAIGW